MKPLAAISVAALLALAPSVSGARQPAAHRAAGVRIMCVNKSGTRYVTKLHPSKCTVFGPGDSFGRGVNLRGLAWHRWGHSTARSDGIENGFHLPPAKIPVKVKAFRIVRGKCGRVYSRLKATSRNGSTTVHLPLCPRKTL